jgi:hypothetical protein
MFGALVIIHDSYVYIRFNDTVLYRSCLLQDSDKAINKSSQHKNEKCTECS